MVTEVRCQFCKRDRYATVYVVPRQDSSLPDLMLCEHTAATIQSVLHAHAVNGTHPALHAQDTVFSPVLAACDQFCAGVLAIGRIA